MISVCSDPFLMSCYLAYSNLNRFFLIVIWKKKKKTALQKKVKQKQTEELEVFVEWEMVCIILNDLEIS